MAVFYLNGNLLNTNCDYICHQVNCQGKMNSGIAKSIRKKWPKVYENYMAKCNAMGLYGNHFMLGDIQIVGLWEDFYATVKHQSIINMFAQNNYGYDGRKYTSYDAFWQCLKSISATVPKGATIAFPDHVGCCRGGANWEVIKKMIEEVLGTNYTVYIYKLEEK